MTHFRGFNCRLERHSKSVNSWSVTGRSCKMLAVAIPTSSRQLHESPKVLGTEARIATCNGSTG
eukprot:10074340-Lingulodinium_polyedra.AAC.1